MSYLRALELRVMLTLVAAWQGAGYVLGAPRVYSSGTLSVIRALHVPFPVWGALFLVLAAGMWTLPKVASWALMVLYGFWAICLAITIFTGEIVGWSGPAWAAALAVCHHLALSRAVEDDLIRR